MKKKEMVKIKHKAALSTRQKPKEFDDRIINNGKLYTDKTNGYHHTEKREEENVHFDLIQL